MSGGSDVRVSDEWLAELYENKAACSRPREVLWELICDLRRERKATAALRQQLAAAQEQAAQAEWAGIRRALEIAVAQRRGNPPGAARVSARHIEDAIRAALPADPSAVPVNEGVERG